MTRKDFIKMCGLLGIGLPLQASMSSCMKDPILKSTDKVIIIGAGAGGMTAAYLLKQRGIEAQILEASAVYGGRMRRTTDFANFPIPLGAEWLHVERGVFSEIINDASVSIDTQTTPYNPDVDFGLLDGQRISVEEVGFTIDQKFINATWFDFFEQYIVPSIASQIAFNKVVESIDYSGAQIRIKTSTEEFLADRVIVSVPIKILQNGAINFSPSLPSRKLDAISKVKVWDGCKAFIAFSEKFYPTFTGFDIRPASAGQKLYYDAAYGQNTNKHVLGLFAVGVGTEPYVQLSDEELKNYMLDELDAIFDGKASASYIKHTFQNWNKEPHIGGAYVYDHENWRRVKRLGDSVGDKLFFAGASYTDGRDWASVHAAARAAKRVVDELT